MSKIIYPEPWWVRLDMHLREGRWYGYGGLVPEFGYEKFGPKWGYEGVTRTASITWWRQRLEVSWHHPKRGDR
jgi:hypothetical protein